MDIIFYQSVSKTVKKHKKKVERKTNQRILFQHLINFVVSKNSYCTLALCILGKLAFCSAGTNILSFCVFC